MRKIFLIGFKDVRLAFRDPAALLLMLLAPFLLTLGMGFVTGSFSGGSSGLSEIPVLLVNQDTGELGQALVDVFQSQDLAELLEPTLLADPLEARRQVDADETTAAVIIPAGYTDSIIPSGLAAAQAPSVLPAPAVLQIEIYINPARPTSAGIVQTIVEEFAGQMELGRIGASVVVSQLIQSGRLPSDPVALLAAGQELGGAMAGDTASQSTIRVQKTAAANEATPFNVLAYIAPGMALMFLMFTVTYGGRSLLTERARGTLPRLLVSPTHTYQVLGGKVLGIFLTGAAQLAILVLASTLMFGLNWGDPLGVAALILAAVFGATGWGVLITAVSRTPGQASNLGTALMLTFGLLGGSFFSLSNLSGGMQALSRITPNAWGVDGFTTLALGGKLADLGAPLLGLTVMGLVLFGISVLLFNRSAIVQR